MDTQINTKILDNLIVGRVEPYIYAFSTNQIPYYLKVGDTYRPVEKRLDEWRKVYPNLVKVFSDVAKVDEEVYFRDYEVHRYLEEEMEKTRLLPSVYPDQPYSKEFFKDAAPGDVTKAIEDIKASYKRKNGKYHFFKNGTPVEFHYNHEEHYEPRKNQEETIDNFRKARLAGRHNLLMYATMRFGKSFTSMCCALDMQARFVLVVSAKADVEAEWKKTVEGHEKFIEYEFLGSEDLQREENILTNTLKKNKVVLFLTLQDLQGKQIKKKHKEVFSNQLDLLLIDETHFGARAKEYGKVLLKNKVFNSQSQIAEELSESDDDLEVLSNQTKELNAKIRIHLSGTPYRILMGGEFEKDDIIAFCPFSDIVRDQENYDAIHLNDDDYKEWDNPYYGFPQMIRFAFTPSKAAKAKLEQMHKNGISYAFYALFKTKSIEKDNSTNKLHRKFEHEKEILDLFEVIDGSKEDANLLGFLNYDKIKDGKLCRHIVCVLPYRASCDALEELLLTNSHVFKNLQDYTIINISGWDNTPYQKIESIQAKISTLEKEGRKSICLTVNKMLTGSTVPEWDTMIFLKDTASPQEYDQAIFRLQNQYIKESIDENGDVIRHNMKPQTLLVDFDPNRLFIMQEKKSKIYNVNTEKNGNERLEERITEDLRISPIITINKGKIHEITPADIMDAVRKYSCTKSVIDEAKDLNIDFSLLSDSDLRNEISKLTPIDSKKGFTFSPTDEEGEDYNYDPDTDDTTSQESGNQKSEENNATNKEQENDLDEWKKKITTLYALVLFYSFLTDSEVKSLEGIILSIQNNDENKRIAKNLGLKFNLLIKMIKSLNPSALSDLDYKIQNINSLLRDISISPIDRAKVAVHKFERFSDSEIVTPQAVADEIINNLKLTPSSGKILDIASKQAEFAYSVYKKLGDACKDTIYSIPTSAIVYEFTLKVYKLLGLNPQNVFYDFNSYDLINSNNKEDIIKRLTDMKFNYVVGNPPYQDQGGSGGNNDAPIYQEFCEIADKITKGVSSLVIKAGWFSAGRENLLGNFRRNMLTSQQVSRLITYSNSSNIFSNVEIKGGICYFIKDKSYKGECEYTLFKDGKEETCMRNLGDFDILIREPILSKIVMKIQNHAAKKGLSTVDSIISSDTPFGIPSNPRISKKTPFKVYTDSTSKHNTLLYHIEKLHRKVEYVSRADIVKNAQDIDFDKVFFTCSSGSGDDNMVLGKPEIAPANSVCSQSYLYAKFPSKLEAENFLAYAKTKFFRILVAAIKITQAAPKKVYRFVPLEDLNKKWTDADLYKEYDLLPDEIIYIEGKLAIME